VRSRTNPVKDNLVAKVSQSPFFSTYKYWAFDEQLKFWYIDWASYWEACGPNNGQKKRPKDYLKWTKFELLPLPQWRDLPKHKIQSRVRNLVKEAEAEFEEDRKRKCITVIGVSKLYQLDPRDRPKTYKTPGNQPLCHASKKQGRKN